MDERDEKEVVLKKDDEKMFKKSGGSPSIKRKKKADKPDLYYKPKKLEISDETEAPEDDDVIEDENEEYKLDFLRVLSDPNLYNLFRSFLETNYAAYERHLDFCKFCYAFKDKSEKKLEKAAQSIVEEFLEGQTRLVLQAQKIGNFR